MKLGVRVTGNFVAQILLVVGVTFALDLGGFSSSANSKIKLSDLSGLSSNEAIESPQFLPSEAIPFVGDGPIHDSAYIIGPGDLFQLYFENSAIERQVNPEGNIILSKIGQIRIEGRTLKEAKKLLLDKLQSTYKKSECFVNLAKPKTIKVFVSGAVMAPGVYEISGNTRISDVLNAARGFSPLAQRDELKIVDRFGNVQLVNLKRFFIEGDLSANPNMPQGGFLLVPFIDYKRPYVMMRRDTLSVPVQLNPGESLLDLIHKFNFYRSTYPFASVLVKEKGKTEYFVLPGELVNKTPSAESVIEILPQHRDIYVAGAVGRPGFQPYRSSRSLLQYVSEAGLLPSSKIGEKMRVIHSDGRKEWLSIQTSELRPGDLIYVDQNAEQRFIIYTPIILSLASFALAIISISQAAK